jgi:Mg-chelatase subunit ChlD
MTWTPVYGSGRTVPATIDGGLILARRRRPGSGRGFAPEARVRLRPPMRRAPARRDHPSRWRRLAVAAARRLPIGAGGQGRQPTKVLATRRPRRRRLQVDRVTPAPVSATLAIRASVDRGSVQRRRKGRRFIFCVDISRSLSAATAAVRNARDLIDEMRPPIAPPCCRSARRAGWCSTSAPTRQVARRRGALGPTDADGALPRFDALELSLRRDPELPARRVVVCSDGRTRGAPAAEDVLRMRCASAGFRSMRSASRPRRRESDLLRFATTGGDFVARRGA